MDKAKKGLAAALAIGATAAIIVVLTMKAKAAPPLEGYTCPYDGQKFNTYEELVAHVQTVHPNSRIPLPITWE